MNWPLPPLDDPAFNKFVAITLTSVLVTWGLISLIRHGRR